MCNALGTDSIAIFAVIGVITLPITVPAAILYGALYAGPKAAGKAIKEEVENATKQRRTTNVLKKMQNKIIKRLKAGEWEAYLQEVYNRAKQDRSSSNLHELGVAMLVAGDAVKAEHYLSEALEVGVGKLRAKQECEVHYSRGLANQLLRDYTQAHEDFNRALALLAAQPEVQCDVATDESAKNTDSINTKPPKPSLTLGDAYNSLGFSLFLQAAYEVLQPRDYSRINAEAEAAHLCSSLPKPILSEIQALSRSVSGEERACHASQLLTKAIANYDQAIAFSAGHGQPRGMFVYNRGRAKYHLALLSRPLDEAESTLLREALADFDQCVTMPNFSTPAEGHAMRAQALAVLGERSEAEAAQAEADKLDCKVFLVDLNSQEQLSTPWPLMRGPQDDEPHDFQQTTIYRPHWCDHCLKLITSTTSVYECARCEFRVHKTCVDKAEKLKTCWKVAYEDKTEADMQEAPTFGPHKYKSRVPSTIRRAFSAEFRQPPPAEHMHHMMRVTFHKPTWCQPCGHFIKWPKGYRCTECRYTTHIDCLDHVKNCVVEGGA